MSEKITEGMRVIGMRGIGECKPRETERESEKITEGMRVIGMRGIGECKPRERERE